MKIGNIRINTPIFLAPMAGITDYPFRIICKEMGAGMVYSEFVSADGIIREPELRLLEEMRHTLNIDRLHAAAIERGARARHIVA